MFKPKLSDNKINQIADLLTEGHTQQTVAEKLGIGLGTVNKYARLKKKSETVGSPKDYETLRQLILDVIRDEFCSLKEEKNSEDKEEKEMGDEVGSKVQELLNQREMLDKLNQLSSLKGDIEAIKANQDGISDLCKRFPGLCEKVEDIENQVKFNIESVKTLCEQFPGLCSTQESIEARLRENEKPKGVLGSDLSLNELLKSERSQENLVNKYMSPAGLIFALQRCVGPDCAKIREELRQKGINIQVKKKGSMPGSSGWKDID